MRRQEAKAQPNDEFSSSSSPHMQLRAAATTQFRRAAACAGPIRGSARQPGRSSWSFEERGCEWLALVGTGIDGLSGHGHPIDAQRQDRHGVEVCISVDNVLDGFFRIVLMYVAIMISMVMVSFARPVRHHVAFIGAAVPGQRGRAPSHGLPREEDHHEEKGNPAAHGEHSSDAPAAPNAKGDSAASLSPSRKNGDAGGFAG